MGDYGDVFDELTHPEFEIRPLSPGGLFSLSPPPKDPTFWKEASSSSTVDYIELRETGKALLERFISPAQFAQYCNKIYSTGTKKTSRIIFVTDPTCSAALDSDFNIQRPPSLDSTGLWLHRTFGVPLFFFGHMHPYTGSEQLNIGQGSLVRYDDKGSSLSVDTFYQCAYDLTSPPAHVWFSYNLRQASLTYVIYNPSQALKQNIFTCAEGRTANLLLRPLAVDTFIAEDSMYNLGGATAALRSILLPYETNFNATMTETGLAMENLHALSQRLNVTRENLGDLQSRLKFLLDVRSKYLEAVMLHGNNIRPQSLNSVSESIALIDSRAEHMKRWVNNYIERTGIRIALLFNLTAQGDSRTNLDIARLTTKISVATQKDSSSMITMAAVTMFFLPGSFVSGFFGMIFFSQSDSEGRQVLSVSPQWWLFPVITVPLTVLVFVIWVIWQRRRKTLELEHVQGVQATLSQSSDSTSEKNIEQFAIRPGSRRYHDRRSVDLPSITRSVY